MRRYSALMMVVVTFAAISSSAAGADYIAARPRVYAIKTGATSSGSNRLLRGAGINSVDDVRVFYPPRQGERVPFIEDRIKRELKNPKNVQQLYRQWYSKGYSANVVAVGLEQNDDRELKETYQHLGMGYAKFVARMNGQLQAGANSAI